MAVNASVIHLRKLLAARFPQRTVPDASFLRSDIATLDQAAGGLPKNAITELVSRRGSAGSATLIHALLNSARRDDYFIALIDGRDSFDACAVDNPSLRHLLWVRCTTAVEAVKAADLLLRDGNFPLVIVDLVLNSVDELRKIPQTTWYRLQRLVEQIPTACLVLSRRSMVSSAQLKIALENSWTLQNLEDDDAVGRLRFRVQRAHLGSAGSVQRLER